MNDPDAPSDTDPTGDDTLSTEVGSDTDPGAPMDDIVPEPPEDHPSDDDADDFFRWLPTMWLNHRRRRELVERPSSDGGDFVAYASTGRPARASPPVRPESTVQVLQALSAGGLAAGGRPDHSDAGRDAPTVLLPRRTNTARRVFVGTVGAALVVAALDLALWMRRPVAHEAALAGPSGEGRSVLAPSAKLAPVPEPNPAAPPPASLVAELPAGARAAAPEPDAAKAPLRPRATGPASVKESRRKVGAPRAPSAGEVAAAVESRPAPAAEPAAPPAKEQYFETQ